MGVEVDDVVLGEEAIPVVVKGHFPRETFEEDLLLDVFKVGPPRLPNGSGAVAVLWGFRHVLRGFHLPQSGGEEVPHDDMDRYSLFNFN